MFEALFEFPEGWGGCLRKNSFRGGGMDIFWNYTIQFILDKKINMLHYNFEDKYFLTHSVMG